MTPTNCPLCLRPLAQQEPKPWHRAAEQNGWQERGFTVFESGVNAATIAPGTSYEKRQPARAATVPSDVWVPALQSAISGVPVGVIVGVVMALNDKPHPLGWGIVAGGVGFCAAWHIILADHRRALWIIEKVTGRDLDDDGFVGEPEWEGEPEQIQVEIKEVDKYGRTKHYNFIKLPIGVTPKKMRALAIATMGNNTPFSRRELSGIISADQYRELRKTMLKGGLLTPKTKGKNPPVELTPSGRAMLRQYLPEGWGND
jgi:hypothetical protein